MSSRYTSKESNGVHVTTAQRLMGHASPMVTLGIYTAVLDDEIYEAGDILRQKLQLNLKEN
jgi:hypothetical protein